MTELTDPGTWPLPEVTLMGAEPEAPFEEAFQGELAMVALYALVLSI